MASKLRNFELTVDEIKVIRAIKDLSRALDNIGPSKQDPERSDYLTSQLQQLENKLEELRERSLIR